MRTRWTIGDSVRVTRNVRNDGTYPGADIGHLLIRRGCVGAVVDVGTFLQDQIIYSVHFLDADRIVGCREEELMGLEYTWIPGRFEARERVVARRILALNANHRVPRGGIGEVLRTVVDDDRATIVYHVHFDCLPGRTLAVPEAALGSLSEVTHV